VFEFARHFQHSISGTTEAFAFGAWRLAADDWGGAVLAKQSLQRQGLIAKGRLLFV
jgi:hypothetical protein